MKRDNDYYRRRLKEKSREDLLEVVERGDMTIYAACVEAGLRNKKNLNDAETLTKRWNRLSKLEKRKFVYSNHGEVKQILFQLHEISKAQKTDAKD